MARPRAPPGDNRDVPLQGELLEPVPLPLLRIKGPTGAAKADVRLPADDILCPYLIECRAQACQAQIPVAYEPLDPLQDPLW